MSTIDEQKQRMLNKYKADLELLENGRRRITEDLAHSDIQNDEIDKKLSRLDKSIERLRGLIDDFDNMNV